MLIKRACKYIAQHLRQFIEHVLCHQFAFANCAKYREKLRANPRLAEEISPF